MLASDDFMGCDAILLDLTSRKYVASNQSGVIALCACVAEKMLFEMKGFWEDVLRLELGCGSEAEKEH